MGHILSLAVHDNAFDGEFMKDISNLYKLKIPADKKSVNIKWKSKMLDIPIFRQPTRTASGHRTSSTEALRAGTWGNYLKRLGLKTGLQHVFTQYVIRRANCNAVNGMFERLRSCASTLTGSRQRTCFCARSDNGSLFERGPLLPQS